MSEECFWEDRARRQTEGARRVADRRRAWPSFEARVRVEVDALAQEIDAARGLRIYVQASGDFGPLNEVRNQSWVRIAFGNVATGVSQSLRDPSGPPVPVGMPHRFQCESQHGARVIFVQTNAGKVAVVAFEAWSSLRTDDPQYVYERIVDSPDRITPDQIRSYLRMLGRLQALSAFDGNPSGWDWCYRWYLWGRRAAKWRRAGKWAANAVRIGLLGGAGSVDLGGGN